MHHEPLVGHIQYMILLLISSYTTIVDHDAATLVSLRAERSFKYAELPTSLKVYSLKIRKRTLFKVLAAQLSVIWQVLLFLQACLISKVHAAVCMCYSSRKKRGKQCIEILRLNGS